MSTGGGTEPLWSHSGRELFFRDGRGNLVAVASRSTSTFALGGTTVLFPAGAFSFFGRHRQYDVSPDDKLFLMIRSIGEAGRSRLIVVDNWFEEL